MEGLGDPDAEIIKAALARFEKGAAVVEATLAGGDHLVPGGFSVADIIVGAVLGFARTAEVAELPPGLVAYVDGLEARPRRSAPTPAARSRAVRSGSGRSSAPIATRSQSS